ncbi:MAG: hypothetical protein QOG66_3458 [Methylobacteriaceae bacterium]|jgi:hypothetical protein|nr:hypothetical protein [Methylobacteriaceae bacterium]
MVAAVASDEQGFRLRAVENTIEGELINDGDQPWQRIDGMRQKFIETAKRRFHTLLPQLVDGLELAIYARRTKRLEWEAGAEARARAERREQRARTSAQREQSRMAFLERLIAKHQKIVAFRTWLADAEKYPTNDSNGDFARMLIWASEELQRLEAEIGPATVEAKLTEWRLFALDGEDMFEE